MSLLIYFLLLACIEVPIKDPGEDTTFLPTYAAATAAVSSFSPRRQYSKSNQLISFSPTAGTPQTTECDTSLTDTLLLKRGNLLYGSFFFT